MVTGLTWPHSQLHLFFWRRGVAACAYRGMAPSTVVFVKRQRQKGGAMSTWRGEDTENEFLMGALVELFC